MKRILLRALCALAIAATAPGIALAAYNPINITSGSNDISISPSSCTGGSCTISATNPINPLGTAASYTILSTDMGKTLTASKSSAVAISLPQAGTTGFAVGNSFMLINLGAGVVTISPATSTINGQTTLALAQYQFAYVTSDGANYIAAVGSSLAGAGTVTSVAPGAGVATTLTGGQSAITGTGSLYLDASYFPNLLSGFTLSNDATSPNTVIDTTLGVATADDNTALMKLAAFTKTTGAWTLGTGNGCLDTGTVANSTWYFLFSIERTDTGVVDELCSISVSAPTFPTNYTKKRLLGAFKTDGSAHIIPFTQNGNRVEWTTAVLDVNTSTLGTSAALETLGSVPTGLNVKPICRYTVGGAGNAVLLTSPAATDVTPTATTPFSASPGFDQLDVNLTGGDENSACPDLVTDTNGEIRARATAASTTLAIVTKGWRY